MFTELCLWPLFKLHLVVRQTVLNCNLETFLKQAKLFILRSLLITIITYLSSLSIYWWNKKKTVTVTFWIMDIWIPENLMIRHIWILIFLVSGIQMVILATITEKCASWSLKRFIKHDYLDLNCVPCRQSFVIQILWGSE